METVANVSSYWHQWLYAPDGNIGFEAQKHAMVIFNLHTGAAVSNAILHSAFAMIIGDAPCPGVDAPSSTSIARAAVASLVLGVGLAGYIGGLVGMLHYAMFGGVPLVLWAPVQIALACMISADCNLMHILIMAALRLPNRRQLLRLIAKKVREIQKKWEAFIGINFILTFISVGSLIYVQGTMTAMAQAGFDKDWSLGLEGSSVGCVPPLLTLFLIWVLSISHYNTWVNGLAEETDDLDLALLLAQGKLQFKLFGFTMSKKAFKGLAFSFVVLTFKKWLF